MRAIILCTIIALEGHFKSASALDLENLESLGIHREFYVNDIAVYFNRAFLAIPRTMCKNNITHPTLVELPWREFNVILKTRFNKPVLERQIWANCEHLQDAVSLAKEGVKSKLWILDRGNEFCPPKIMAYNMFQDSFLNGEVIELAKEPKNALNTIEIENGTKFGDHRAFIANTGDDTILVCYLKNMLCNSIKLARKQNPSSMPVRVNFLSISKVDSKMYLTVNESLQVFSLEMKDIGDEYSEFNHVTLAVNVTLCGEKLGPSSGLETDLKDGLIYYLTRDHAIARWTTDKPMQAEFHDILAQSFKRMPYVSRIFTDPQGSIFALVNPFSPFSCSITETTAVENGIQTDDILERIVKIMKYNRLLNKFL